MTKHNELINYITNLTDEQIDKIVDYLPQLNTLANTTNNKYLSVKAYSTFENNTNRV